MQDKLRQLLKDYTLEQVLEAGELEAIEALELLITYGALNTDKLSELGEGVDGET